MGIAEFNNRYHIAIERGAISSSRSPRFAVYEAQRPISVNPRQRSVKLLGAYSLHRNGRALASLHLHLRTLRTDSA